MLLNDPLMNEKETKHRIYAKQEAHALSHALYCIEKGSGIYVFSL